MEPKPSVVGPASPAPLLADGTSGPSGVPATPGVPVRTAGRGTATISQEMLESLVEAHVVMDAQGVVVGWNREAQLLLGWTREEAVGREAAELFIPEEFRGRHRAGLERVRTTGRSTMAGKRLEVAAVDRAGRRFPVELTIRIDASLPPGDPNAVFHGLLHDITERHHAQHELRDREAFLQSLIDSLDVGVLACDETGQLMLVNKALRQAHARAGSPFPLTGRSTRTGLGEQLGLHRPDGHLLSTDELPLVRALRGETVEGEEVLLWPPDRPARRFRVTGRRVHGFDGELRGAVVELRDVTAAHDAALMRAGAAAFAMETCRHRHRRRLAATRPERARRRAGVGTGRLLGRRQRRPARPGEQLAARTDRRGLEPRPGARGAGGQRAVVAGLPPAGAGGCGHAPAGQTHAGARRVTFPVTSGSRTIGVLEFSDNGYGEPGPELVSLLLTVSAQIARHGERRRAEELAETLAEERATFDRVLRQVDDHVWSVELLEDGSMRSHYASPNVSSVLGGNLPEGTDPGAHIMDRIHPDDLPRFLEYLRRGQEGQVADVEVRIVGFDDVVRWIWVRGVPRNEGRRRFVDGISSDVTERRELQVERERLLRQAQQQTERQLAQLHELDRMKDEFLATMSHELRNPVSVIRGYADLVLESPDVPPPVRSMMDVIRRRTQQLHQLVEELFADARLEAGLVELQREPVDLDHLVGELSRSYARDAEQAGLTLTVHRRVRRPGAGGRGAVAAGVRQSGRQRGEVHPRRGAHRHQHRGGRRRGRGPRGRHRHRRTGGGAAPAVREALPLVDRARAEGSRAPGSGCRSPRASSRPTEGRSRSPGTRAAARCSRSGCRGATPTRSEPGDRRRIRCGDSLTFHAIWVSAGPLPG